MSNAERLLRRLDEVANIIGKERLPDSEEIREQVDLCRTWLVRQGLCSH